MLQPGTPQKLDVMSMFKDLPATANWATVSILTNSRPDDVIAVAASYDDSGRYGTQTPFSDQMAGHWEGGLWQMDATHNSMITVGNGGRKDTHVQLVFRYQTDKGPDTYTIQQPLQRDQQLFIDLSELARAQKPDINGHIFPATVTSGTYSLRDIDDFGIGNLFEGKVVTDKTSGDATYGCMICCGERVLGLFPDPLGLGISDLGYYNGQARNSCTRATEDITDYYDTWWSNNTSVITVQTASARGVAPGSTTAQATGLLSSPAVTEDSPDECPTQDLNNQAPTNVSKVTITNADLEANQVSVTVSGPAGTTGTLVITANGVNNHPQASASGGTAVGPGQYTVSFNRPTMPADTYASLTAQWNISPPVSSNYSLTRTWLVLGVIRHSQYNTPYESACTGSPQTAWVFTPTCSFTQTTLKSDFISQTYLNGSGVSMSNGDVQYNNGQLCSGKYPNGANTQNSFLKVGSINGACGSAVVGGDSVATYPSPNAGNPYGCGDNLQLVTSANSNQALKHVADYCPACNSGFNGTSGHMDDYSATQACSGGAVGDYGNFWTADTH